MWNDIAHSTSHNSTNFTLVSPQNNATNYGMCATGAHSLYKIFQHYTASNCFDCCGHGYSNMVFWYAYIMQHNAPMLSKTSAIMTLLVWQFVKQIATLAVHMQKLSYCNTMENLWFLPYYKVYILYWRQIHICCQKGNVEWFIYDLLTPPSTWLTR